MKTNAPMLQAGKLCLCWLLLLLAFAMPALQAQPLSVALQIGPRPSPYLSDWEQRAESQVVISITNTSAQVQQVYFTGTVTGDNGVSGQTKQGFKPPRPLQVPPNTTTSYTGPQLKGMFVWDEIQTQGVNVANVTRSGMLPAGEYELCVTVKSFQTDAVLTSVQPSGCTPTFTIALPQPPVITTPPCEETISSAQGQPIIFSWMPMAGTPQRVQYRLRIVEIIGNRSPNDAMQSATTPPVFDKTINGNSYLVNPVQIATPNRPGPIRFAWTVQAIDPSNKTLFSNNGESEACSFEYGKGNTIQASPETSIGIKVEVVIGRRTKGCTGFGVCAIFIDGVDQTPVPPVVDPPTKPDPPRKDDPKGVPDSRLDPKKPKVYATLNLSGDRKALTISLSESDIRKYQPDKMVYFKGKTSVTFEEDNPIGKLLIIPAGTYPMSFSGSNYAIYAAVKLDPAPVTAAYYSIGWGWNCEKCNNICATQNKGCDLGFHFYSVDIPGKNFREKNGNRWRKKRLFKYECREEQCYNMWTDLCCAYRITTDAVEVPGGEFWEVGTTGATGATTWTERKPGDDIPCSCGKLFDILQGVNAEQLLRGGSWDDRVDRVESRLKLYCPGLTLATLPSMAEKCGFAGAAKAATGVSSQDKIEWLAEFLEAFSRK